MAMAILSHLPFHEAQESQAKEKLIVKFDNILTFGCRGKMYGDVLRVAKDPPRMHSVQFCWTQSFKLLEGWELLWNRRRKDCGFSQSSSNSPNRSSLRWLTCSKNKHCLPNAISLTQIHKEMKKEWDYCSIFGVLNSVIQELWNKSWSGAFLGKKI